MWAQNPQDQTPANPPQTQDNGKPKQDVPAEAGGPGDNNVGPYAIPKKKAEDAPPPPPPVAPRKPDDLPDYSLKVNVPLVNVDVLVTTKDGQFVPGLKQENFRSSRRRSAAAGDALHGLAGADHGRAAG